MILRELTTIYDELGQHVQRPIPQIIQQLSAHDQSVINAILPLLGLAIDPASPTMLIRSEQQPRWRVAALRKQDVSAFFHLFNRVFEHPFNDALFAWKYPEDKCAHHSNVVVWDEQRLIAHTGLLARSLILKETTIEGYQIADVMVDPDYRGILTRNGPFALATRVQLNLAQLRYQLGFGFPNPRAFKVAERLQLYQAVDHIYPWQAVPQPSLDKLRLSCLSGADLLHPRYQIDPLCHTMLQSHRHQILGKRDLTYLKQRYLHHPTVHYHYAILQSRWLKTTQALLIWRVEADHWRLMDIITSPHYFRVALVAWLDLAYQQKVTKVYAWWTSSASALLNDLGEFESTALSIPVSKILPHYLTQDMGQLWWLTCGDTDFM